MSSPTRSDRLTPLYHAAQYQADDDTESADVDAATNIKSRLQLVERMRDATKTRRRGGRGGFRASERATKRSAAYNSQLRVGALRFTETWKIYRSSSTLSEADRRPLPPSLVMAARSATCHRHTRRRRIYGFRSH